MGLFTIDRTINFSEEKVKKVLEIIKTSTTVDEIEDKMVSQRIVNLQEGTSRHGFFTRRWVTFLKDFEVYDGQKLTELGQLYINEDLSTKELLFLLLMRRVVKINGKYLRPFEQIVLVSQKLQALGHNQSITKDEFEKIVALIGIQDAWDFNFVTDLIIENRQGHGISVDAHPGPAHFDIWKNLMIAAGLAEESNDIKIDFTNITLEAILTYFKDVEPKEEELGLFNDSFVKYINIGVNIRNENKVIMNDSLMQYQGVLKSKLKYSDLVADEKEGETMRINGVSDNLSIEELADILEKMYNTPEESGKAMSPIIFGFKYAHVIDINRYSIANILSKTSLPKSYEVEIKKGMNAYRAVHKGEYGISLDLLKIEEEVDIDDYVKFKNLLRWFVRQLNINNKVEEGKPTSGQGYKEGAGIREYYKSWRDYGDFTLDCNIVSGYQGLSSKVNYINKTDSGINIRPEFDRTTKRVVAVYIDLYNESESLYEDISALKDEKYDIEALGLFDNNLPNELLKQLFDKYREIIKEDLEKKNNSINQIKYKTQCVNEITDSNGKVIKLARNRIFFGAPGTGKSFELNEQTKKFIGGDNTYYERVTFHPEYTHSGFFGTYKPVPNSRDVDKITYAFIPGPFLRVLSKALINANSDGEKKPYVLLIEEINRANVASVFGEVFQLLDREDDGANVEFLNASKYSISPSEDVKKYLVDEFKKAGLETTTEAFSDIRIPDNMFIWASMNSADQGVFPMDTAFKRRWEFEYFGINKSEEKIKEYFFKVNEEVINWNALRKAINYRLTSLKINEDKLMGPFFMSNKVLNACTYDHSIVVKAIQNKVIMYLFEDAGRQKRKDIFVNGYEKTYSEICADFEEKGLNIFAKEIVDKYNEIK